MLLVVCVLLDTSVGGIKAAQHCKRYVKFMCMSLGII